MLLPIILNGFAIITWFLCPSASVSSVQLQNKKCVNYSVIVTCKKNGAQENCTYQQHKYIGWSPVLQKCIAKVNNSLLFENYGRNVPKTKTKPDRHGSKNIMNICKKYNSHTNKSSSHGKHSHRNISQPPGGTRVLLSYGDYCNNQNPEEICNSHENLTCRQIRPWEDKHLEELYTGACDCELPTIGNPCNTSDDCAYLSHMTCLYENSENATCRCKPTMLYNGTQCVVKAGFSCARNSNCIPNAECDDQSVCQCVKNFMVGPGATCLPGFDAPCSSNSNVSESEDNQESKDDCNKHVLLECMNSTETDSQICRCELGYRWSESHKRCEALLGTHCFYTPCVAEARCNPAGYCECLPKYLTESEFDSACYLKYGESCGKHSENREVACSRKGFFDCHNGFCDCELPEHQFYDTDSEKCVGFEGAYCGHLAGRNGDWRYFDCMNGTPCIKGKCDSSLRNKENLLATGNSCGTLNIFKTLFYFLLLLLFPGFFSGH